MSINRHELIKLLCMSDQELIELFEKKEAITCLPYAFQYDWRKRLSIYSKPSAVTSHEYKWLVDALRCHSHDEILLLREEIERFIKTEEGDLNEKDEKENEKNKNLIKKAQSCPSFLNSSYPYTIKDALEKTINGC